MDRIGMWNIRGMNLPNNQHEIKRFLLQNKVGLFGLLETKQKPKKWNKSIHAKVLDKSRKKLFWLTVVYGLNHAHERNELWDSLRGYHSKVSGPWLVGGDFNAVMARDERIVGAPLSNTEIQPMLQATQDCHLVDLSARISFFTWSNKHESDTNVYSRIDRVFSNAEWTDIFPDGYVHFLPKGTFDHCPCLVNFEVEHQRRGATFKYFNMWSMAPGYSDIVKTRWQKECKGTPMYKVVTQLRGLKAALKALNEEQFDNIENLTHMAEIALQKFQELLILDPLNEQLCQNEKECAKEVIDLRKARHQFLSQKMRIPHTFMRPLEEEDPKIEWTAEEVKSAIFDIPRTKALVPDGYNNKFFIDNWEIVGQDVIAALQRAFYFGKVLKQSNNTIITLIPKVEVPETVMLSHVLPDIINPSQSAFIEGRDIVGNILICHDLVKLYNRKSCSPLMLMKPDLQKAYDSVEWDFMKYMLIATGFLEHFCHLLMQCISTPSYSISLNGDIFGFFKGKRGLRQGDPLSPLLLTLCLEYLSRVSRVIQQHPDLKYHSLCNRIQLTHLCFADDLMLFCHGDRASIDLLLKAFAYFSKATGLSMNRGKSNFYGNGLDGSLIKEIEDMTGMHKGSVPFKYLGVNVSPKRLSVLDCHYLTERIVARIRSIGSKKLSYAGITYLWHSTDQKESLALVSWSQICQPLKQGGLGLRYLHSWNIAAIGKYVWWVAMKADHLWVKWVHVVYIKQSRWKEYEPGAGCSWAWRNICQVKNIYRDNLFVADEVEQYTLTQGYQWIKPDGDMVSWYPWMLNSWIIPRHTFMSWLVAQHRLLTQDRLIKMHIIQENRCFLCGLKEETHEHLFFGWTYSRMCLQLGTDWCLCPLHDKDCIKWWTEWRHPSTCRKKIVAVILASLMARIWFCRNISRMEGLIWRPSVLYSKVKHDVLIRIGQCDIKAKNSRVIDWVRYLTTQ
ncbi:uncharacterized protein LOC141618246 [Silene latifolia]|uniref:uncharacterized protein LOC141618246 n=1 Tax=Silene latifolia TaxID=37657 RepID=UPI003D77096C